MCKLTEVMRQQSHPLFIDILNAALICELSDKGVEVLNSSKSDTESVLTETTVIFAKNCLKDSYN